MDKFQAMQAFIRVVESGTFTKAAQTLDLPKTAVTRLIASLEVELGTKLLNRTTRKVSTTADGAAYYERALQLMSDLAELEHGHVIIRTIASRTNRPFPIVVTKDRERVEVQNRRGLASNDIMACLTMSLAGLGVVHALTFSATTHLRSGALEAVLHDWVSDSVPVFVAYQPNRHLSTKVRVFIDWLAELFASNESTAKSRRSAKT